MKLILPLFIAMSFLLSACGGSSSSPSSKSTQGEATQTENSEHDQSGSSEQNNQSNQQLPTLKLNSGKFDRSRLG